MGDHEAIPEAVEKILKKIIIKLNLLWDWEFQIGITD